MKKCPLSFNNPSGSMECIKTDCPKWINSRKWMIYTHPRHDELYTCTTTGETPNEKMLLALPGILDQELYTEPSHCKDFGVMD